MVLKKMFLLLMAGVLWSSVFTASIEIQVVPSDADIYLERDSTLVHHDKGSSIVKDLEPGSYTLQVTHDGCDSKKKTVTITDSFVMLALIDLVPYENEPHNEVFFPEGCENTSPPEVIYRYIPENTKHMDFIRRMNISGTIWLDVTVLNDGSIGDITLYRSLEEGLDKEVIDAVKNWKFKPGNSNGKPVVTIIRIPVIIKLVRQEKIPID